MPLIWRRDEGLCHLNETVLLLTEVYFLKALFFFRARKSFETKSGPTDGMDYKDSKDDCFYKNTATEPYLDRDTRQTQGKRN
ncbi:hypothetical protein VINI7043_11121 [Vibrio nigripulchritudo ATCC 27043]|nr:hypothetical protein VINI7043_11121 [Vibrio nigripulchritudo ATCC 27043]BDU45394.1 hypothetical protein TUMSATVNIG3_41920 [Vibrio nigripulchritudo]